MQSEGRAGKGIYFASELGKATAKLIPAAYKPSPKSSPSRIGVGMLGECVLEKEHHVTRDFTSAVAPPGVDSIVGMGRTEPDPDAEVALKLDGRFVAVPQGKPLLRKEFALSSFSQSEYCVLNPDHVKLRFVCVFKCPPEPELGNAALATNSTFALPGGQVAAPVGAVTVPMNDDDEDEDDMSEEEEDDE